MLVHYFNQYSQVLSSYGLTWTLRNWEFGESKWLKEEGTIQGSMKEWNNVSWEKVGSWNRRWTVKKKVTECQDELFLMFYPGPTGSNSFESHWKPGMSSLSEFVLTCFVGKTLKDREYGWRLFFFPVPNKIVKMFLTR